VTRRALLASAAAALHAQPRRPNVIVIVTDDQGIGDLGCYGASDARTPHLDKLAASGARLTSFYSNCPVCSPSRASILTGKYPQRHGIEDVLTSTAQFNTPGLRAGETSLAAILKQAGYRTAAIGKWHMGSAPHSRPLAQGFDEFYGFYSGWTDYLSHRYYTLGRGQSEILHDLWRNEQEVWEDPKYQTSLFERESLAFLNRQRAGTPFFLYLAFGAPHYPMMAPEQYLNRFPASMDRDRRMHLAMVAAVDDAVGAILAVLEKRGLARDTIIHFQSDNGATQETRADHAGRPYRGGSNAPFRGFKQGLFEGGIRVPAIIRAPGLIKPGQVIGEPVAAMDLLPTLMNLTGAAPVPDGTDGRDITPVLTTGAKSPHDELHWKYLNQRAVRRGDWKLIVNAPEFAGEPKPARVWLSNLKDDPAEKRNYAVEQPAVVEQLQLAIQRWDAAVK